jgi:hypothetical protein
MTDEDAALLEWEPIISTCKYMGWNFDEYFTAPADMVDAIRARMTAGVGNG